MKKHFQILKVILAFIKRIEQYNNLIIIVLLLLTHLKNHHFRNVLKVWWLSERASRSKRVSIHILR